MAHWLLERLHDFGGAPAIVWQDRTHSYRILLERIGRWRHRLAADGIADGDSIALEARCSLESCALLLALLQNRNVIVPLDPAAGRERARTLEVARVRGVYKFASDDTWTFCRPEAVRTHPLLESVRSEGTPGLILCTSGSSGESKALLLNLDRFLTRFQKPRTSARTLVFLRLEHIGGINTLFHVLAGGGTLIPCREHSPQAVCQVIESAHVELLPTTPTFLNMLLISEVYRKYDLSSLKLITYGTEPMPASTLHRLNHVFPGVRFKQTYGLSEVGILPTASQNSQSLWMKLGGDGFETKIVDGILWVRACSAMLGYLNAPSPFDGDGWFCTGDVVATDGDYVRVLGRASEVINVGGQKVYPAEVESVLLRMANIRDVTVYGRPNPVTGQVVVASISLLQPEDPEQLEQRLRTFCRGQLEDYQVPVLLTTFDAEHHGRRFKKNRPTAGPACEIS